MVDSSPPCSLGFSVYDQGGGFLLAAAGPKGGARTGAAGFSAGRAPVRPATRVRLAMAQLGGDPVEVARRAGHTAAVLLKVYAQCLDGATAMANARIDEALKGWK
jgi:hypothetical protein